MAQFNATVPLPDTALDSLAVKEGWIDEKLAYSQLRNDQSVLRTEALSSIEILRNAPLTSKEKLQ